MVTISQRKTCIIKYGLIVDYQNPNIFKKIPDITTMDVFKNIHQKMIEKVICLLFIEILSIK